MKFKKVYIEITNQCNLDCSFCPPTKRRMQRMEVSEFKLILNELIGYTQYVHFHVKGEPLMHPDINDLFELCYEKGFKVNITTNGTLIHRLTPQLKGETSLRQVSISLQSIADQNELDLNSYMNRIFAFVNEAREKANIFIEFRLWNFEDGNKIKPRNREILKRIENEFDKRELLEKEIQPGKSIKIANHIFLSQANRFEWPNIDREFISTKGYCYGLKTHFAILVDGTMTPCCLDAEGVIDLGNVYKMKGLEQILNGDRVNAIREGFANRMAVEPLCQRCGYRERFGLQ